MMVNGGARWRSWLRHCATRSRVRFPMVTLEYFIDLIFPAALRFFGDPDFKRNEHQEYFLGVKAAGA